jgi:hypothetical protein
MNLRYFRGLPVATSLRTSGTTPDCSAKSLAGYALIETVASSSRRKWIRRISGSESRCRPEPCGICLPIPEYIAGNAGVGYRMLMAGQTFQVADMFVCLLMFTAAGMLLSYAFSRAERRFDAWRRAT